MWLFLTISRALLRKYKVLSTVSIASQISSGTGPLCYKEPYRNLDVTSLSWSRCCGIWQTLCAIHSRAIRTWKGIVLILFVSFQESLLEFFPDFSAHLKPYLANFLKILNLTSTNDISWWFVKPYWRQTSFQTWALQRVHHPPLW